MSVHLFPMAFIWPVEHKNARRLIHKKISHDLLNLDIALTKLQQELYCTERDLLFVTVKK